jgi:hypothetical protein
VARNGSRDEESGAGIGGGEVCARYAETSAPERENLPRGRCSFHFYARVTARRHRRFSHPKMALPPGWLVLVATSPASVKLAASRGCAAAVAAGVAAIRE